MQTLDRLLYLDPVTSGRRKLKKLADPGLPGKDPFNGLFFRTSWVSQHRKHKTKTHQEMR